MACYHHHHAAGCGCSTQSTCSCGSNTGCSCGSNTGCSRGSSNGCSCGTESGCGCRHAAADYTACCRRIGGASDEGCSCGTHRWNCGTCGGWNCGTCGTCGGWNRPDWGGGWNRHCCPDWDWDDDEDSDEDGAYEDVYYGYVLNTILAPGEDMVFTEGYNSAGSGIYSSGSGVTLSPGVYRVSYSGNARPVGATSGLVYSGVAVTLGGYTFPPSTDVVAHSFDTTASLGRTFVVTVSSPTVLRVTNATQQGISTEYTSFNLVIERIG